MSSPRAAVAHAVRTEQRVGGRAAVAVVAPFPAKRACRRPPRAFSPWGRQAQILSRRFDEATDVCCRGFAPRHLAVRNCGRRPAAVLGVWLAAIDPLSGPRQRRTPRSTGAIPTVRRAEDRQVMILCLFEGKSCRDHVRPVESGAGQVLGPIRGGCRAARRRLGCRPRRPSRRLRSDGDGERAGRTPRRCSCRRGRKPRASGGR